MARDIEDFIVKLNNLSNKAFDAADKHIVAGKMEGLACYYLGRCISCFMGVKTLLFALNHAGSTPDFAEKYIGDLPERFPRKDVRVAERYMKETHMAIRFVLFQNFYSQTEFTFRIIQRAKFPEEGRRNPFKLMAEKYGIMPDNIPEFLNDIRNTIHNNGHYFPSDNTDKTYNFKRKEFKFTQGRVIDDVTMMDILTIVDFILEEVIRMFEDEEVASIEFE
jgi:hypothetical protein